MSAIVKSEGMSLQEVQSMATMLAKSGGDFVPQHLKTPGAIAAAILTGQELGLPPMASMRGLYVVKGKVGLSYDLQIALLKKNGYRLDWIEQSKEKAELKLTAPDGSSMQKSYTAKDAEEAGLLNSSDPWRKHRHIMLAARLVGFMCRSFAAEIMTGVYSKDEIDEIKGGNDVDEFAMPAGKAAEVQERKPARSRQPIIDVEAAEETAAMEDKDTDEVNKIYGGGSGRDPYSLSEADLAVMSKKEKLDAITELYKLLGHCKDLEDWLFERGMDPETVIPFVEKKLGVEKETAE